MNEIKTNGNTSPELVNRVQKKTPEQKVSNETSQVKDLTLDAVSHKEVSAIEKTQKASMEEAQPTTKSVSVEGDVEKTVEQLNDYVQSLNRSIHFSFDNDAGKTVVTVTDDNTGKVIRQIPDDLLLELAKKMHNNEPLEILNLQA